MIYLFFSKKIKIRPDIKVVKTHPRFKNLTKVRLDITLVRTLIQDSNINLNSTYNNNKK